MSRDFANSLGVRSPGELEDNDCNGKRGQDGRQKRLYRHLFILRFILFCYFCSTRSNKTCLRTCTSAC
jgi:hypothetical protein